MSNMRYGHTGINGVQNHQALTCRECGADYVGHHLTKECDDCRFKKCVAPGCHSKIKKSVRRSYCSDDCRLSDPQANKMPVESRKTTTCPCGVVFPRYSGSGRKNPGSRRKYCSDECEKEYYTRPPTSEEQKEKIRAATKGKPKLKLRGYKQSEEHLIKRLGNGSIRPSKEELSLVPTLAKYGFRHTGDGAAWRRWPDGTTHNPDFINEDTRTVLEYFGSYWHQDDVGREDYIRDQWKQLGYDCVIVWDTDREVFLDDPAVFL